MILREVQKTQLGHLVQCLLARCYLLCAVSGLTWDGIAYLLVLEWIPGIGVTIAVSPLIGLLVGLAHRPTYAFPLILRVFLALVTLYAATALFGLVMGAVEAVLAGPGTIKSARIEEFVGGALWWVTFTGSVLVLWPLGFANHWLLGRTLKSWGRRNESREIGYWVGVLVVIIVVVFWFTFRWE